MADPSNAGPYEIGVDGTLQAGETVALPFEEAQVGPRQSRGYLEKLYGQAGGLDYIFIVNQSGEPITGSAGGGDFRVPSATSQTLDSGPYTGVTVTNAGSSDVNTGASDDVSVQVGNNIRQDNPEFSTGQALSDLIPGVSFGGQ